MAIQFSNLIVVCAASRPDDDTSVVGGAADAAARPLDGQPSVASDIAMVSDGADSRTVTLEYRDGAGDAQTAAPSLNGTTEVTFGVSTAEILRITAASADASRTVTFREGAGGPTLHTLNPDETEAVRQFRKAISATGAKDYFEKYFVLNNGSEARSVVEYLEQADAAGIITFALEGSVNGTGTATNRLTDPGFTFDNLQKSGGDLAPGDAQGVWYKLPLGIDEAAATSTWTTRVVSQAA